MITLQQKHDALQLLKDFEAQSMKHIHWKAVVETWIERHKFHKGSKPTISPMASKHLKEIALNLYERALEKNSREWTDEYCRYVLGYFFDAAFKVEWLQNKFALHLINQSFDIIINNGKSISNQQQRKGIDLAEARDAILRYSSSPS